MGQAHGYWTGKEIEYTQFYGMDTVFIARMAVYKKVRAMFPTIDHWFFCHIDPLFITGSTNLTVHMEARTLLEQGKYVTIEVAAENHYVIYQLTDLRVAYPKTFCMLVVVPVPKVLAGGFAMKAAPPAVFRDDVKLEEGVVTAPFLSFKPTLWSEYEADKDGVAI